jgi:hypothetical protein
MSWCLLQLMAEALDGDHIPRTALDLFDRLRLREPLGHAFQAIGLEGEEGWRTAARVKILLLVESEADKAAETATRGPDSDKSVAASRKITQAAAALASEASSASVGEATRAGGPASRIPADLWSDPDVRWLTGYNEAEGHAYVVRERYEELLWWLSLPDLIKLANVPVPTRAAASAISRKIEEEVAAMERAGYRVDVLLKGEKQGTLDQPDATTLKTTVVGRKPGENAPMPEPEDLEPEEPMNTRPAGPGMDPEGPPDDY